MACQLDLLFHWRSVKLGMNVVAALLFILFLLDHERVRFGVSILAHARNLPGDFHVGALVLIWNWWFSISRATMACANCPTTVNW